MKKILLFLCILFEALTFKASAGNGSNDSALHAKAAQWMNNAAGLRFLENKGQMMDMQRKPVPNVLYEASGGGMDVYITTSGLSYMFVKFEKHKKKNSSTLQFKFKQHNDSITETYCRADMQLAGASIKKENIVQEGESTDRSDYYYGGICPNGILNVHSYEKVTIKNIYPGIDWVLHTGKQGLKYDFVVHPGANPSLIKLKYKWTDKPQLQEDGSIKISTPMGNITEGNPVSYCNGEQVQTTYVVKDSEIHFNVGDYNSTQTLIIDPILVWATYYEALRSLSATDAISSMNEDGTNVWITGQTTYPNFPTLNPGNGAYFQGTLTNINGTAFILKFNIAGVLKWATYYGGNEGDAGNSINSDGKNVWVTGYTQSPNFPTLNPGGGAYFQSVLGTKYLGVGSNAFILQFDTAGVRKWATYYGGSSYDTLTGTYGGDVGYSINSDGKNVWVTGSTGSSNFPTANPGGSTFSQSTLKGPTNVFILQFNTGGRLIWATYYGGDDGDYGFSIQSDGNNVWVTGQTGSTNFPTFNPGGGAYFQNPHPGGAFILQFNTAGVRKWATCYAGSKGSVGYSIQSDGTNVWVTGWTYSTDFPVYNPGGGTYFQGTNAATYINAGNAFILKFNTAGVCKWATYYGGSGGRTYYGDVGNSIQSNGNNVWVSGWTCSADFPLLNSGCGFYQDTLGRNSDSTPSRDVFILQFDTSGIRKWATYCGTDIITPGSNEAFTSIWSDKTNLFVLGSARYAGYPLVNPGDGAYYLNTSIGFFSQTPYIGKFIIAENISVSSAVNSICKGDSIMLSASGAMAYSWNPVTGLSNTHIANPYAKPGTTTTYTVIGFDTGACVKTYIDSVKVIVDTIGKILLSPHDTSICPGSSVTLDANGGTNYTWSTGATTSSIPIIDASATKTYSVTISDGACIRGTSVTVTVVPLKVRLSGNKIVCIGDTVQLTVSGGTSYQWSNGNTSNTYYTGPILADSIITVEAYNSLGCSHDTSVTVSAVPRPVPIISGLLKVCIGEPDTLTASGGTSYLWNNGNITKSSYIASVKHDTTITVTAYNSAACYHDTSITIIPNVPILNACCNSTIVMGNDTTLVAKGNTAYPYQWSPQVTCLNPPLCDSVKVSPAVTTTYTIIMTDSMGCEIERTLTINVELPCTDLTIPNVFTPDYAGSMGLNNVFYFQTSPLISLWSIIIYNRWGKEMFHSTNPTQYWDGNTESGGKAPDGVYYYIISASCQGKSYKKDGFLQLIR